MKKSEKHGNLEKRRAKKKSRIVLSSNTPKNESTWCLYMCSRRLRRLLRFTEPHNRPEHLLILYHDNMFNL